MKKIFVHIGGHKTGSTAIQEHLKINKKNLTSKGYFYYDTYESNTFSKLINSKNIKIKKLIIKNIIKEIDKNKYKNIILSRGSLAGNILNKYNDAKTFAVLLNEFKKKGYDIKIIYFVRDPVPFLLSTFFQLKKNKKFTNINFYKYINNFKPELFFLKTINGYKHYFKNKLLIKNYSRVYKNDKQFINFFSKLINIKFPIKMINKKINISYNKDLQYISNILDKETNNFERKKILKILSFIHRVISKTSYNKHKETNIYVDSDKIKLIKNFQKNKIFTKLNKKYNTKLKQNYIIKPIVPNNFISFIFSIILILTNFIYINNINKEKIKKIINLVMPEGFLKKILNYF